MKLWLFLIFIFSISSQAFDRKYFQSEVPATNFKGVTVSQAIQSLQRKAKDISGANSGFNYAFSPKASKKINQKISVSLTALPLYEAIKYTALVANLQIKFENSTVLILADGEKFKDPVFKDKFTKLSPQMITSLKLSSSKIDFDETPLMEAGKNIQKSTRALDPQKKGVNLLIVNANPNAKVSLKAEGMQIYSLLRYMAFSAGVQMKMEKSVIVFTSPSKKSK